MFLWFLQNCARRYKRSSHVIYYLSDEKVPVGTAMLILNIPLFLMGIKLIGKKFIIKTLYGTALLSVLIDAMQPFTDYFVENYLASTESHRYTPDILLYSIFGGLLMGMGLAWCSDPGDNRRNGSCGENSKSRCTGIYNRSDIIVYRYQHNSICSFRI